MTSVAKWVGLLFFALAVPTEIAALYVKWQEGVILSQEAEIKLQTARTAKERQLAEAMQFEEDAKKADAIAENAEARQAAEAKLEEQKARIEKQVAENAALFRRAEATEKEAQSKIKDAQAGLSAARAQAEAELAIAKAQHAATLAQSDIYIANAYRGTNPKNIGTTFYDLAYKSRGGIPPPSIKDVLAVCKK